MELLPFDEQAAMQEGQEDTTTTSGSGLEYAPFDEEAAANEGLGIDEGIEYSPSMRRLLGLPELEETVAQEEEIVAETVGSTTTEIAAPITTTPSTSKQTNNIDLPSPTPMPAKTDSEGVETGTTDYIDDEPFSVGTTLAEDRAMEEGTKDIHHKLKLAGESMILSTAELADMFLGIVSYDFGFGDTSVFPDIELEGVPVTPLNYKDVAREAIVNAYGSAGLVPALEEVKSTADIGIKLFAENVGPGVALKGIDKALEVAEGVSKAGKLPDWDTQLSYIMPPRSVKPTEVKRWSDDLLKTEAAISASGAGMGTVFAGLTDGEIKEKMATAEIGNLAGIASHVLLDISPTVAVAKKITKLFSENGDMMQGDALYKASERSVNKFILSLVPRTELPVIKERLRVIKNIQELYPDFKPTVGNVIGTEEAIKVQRLTDTANYEKAAEQFSKTRAAMKQMTTDLQEITDPSQQVMIASALRYYSKEAAAQVVALQDEIVSVESQLRNITRSEYTSSQVGKDIRGHLKDLKEQYRVMKNGLYDEIDPENTINFNSGPLITRVRASASSSNIEHMLDPSDPGYTYLTETLPKFIEDIAEEGAESGFMAISFNDLHAIRKQLGKRAANISRTNPESNSPSVLISLKEEIDGMIEKVMISGDAGVQERFKLADKFYREEYRPRFMEGVGEDLLDVSRSGTPHIKADEVGQKFWISGDKETNLEEFNKIFSSEKAKENLGDFYTETTEATISNARLSLKKYALRSLENALGREPDSNALNVLTRWEQQYQGALKTFTDVADEVAIIREDMTRFESMRVNNTMSIDRMKRDIIEKYSGINPSEVVDGVLQKSPEESMAYIQDVLRASILKTGAEVPTDYRFPLTVEALPDQYQEIAPLVRALKDSVVQKLIDTSYDPTTQMTGWRTLDTKLSSTYKSHLKNLFTDEEIEGLHDFSNALRLLGTETKPIKKVELNKLKETFDNLGFSTASILSRYYSAQLGKVGPLYLAVDALSRAMNKTSDKYFKQAYEKAMYDLEGLENVLEHMDEISAMDEVADIRKRVGMFKGTTREAFNGWVYSNVFDPHKLLAGYRVSETSDDIEAGTLGSLSENFLLVNDPYTGQSSRTVTDYEDEVSNEELDAEMEEYKKRRPQKTLTTTLDSTTDTTPTDKVPEVEEETSK